MTLTEFATEVLNILGRGGDNVDTALSARLLPSGTNYGIINRAIKRIARNWGWKELRVTSVTDLDTVASQNYVDISGLDPIRYIVDIRLMDEYNSRKLIRKQTGRQVDRQAPYTSLETYPTHYLETYHTISDVSTHVIELWATPNAAYDLTVRYSKWPDNYTTTETPEITQIDDVIINLSVSMAFGAIGEHEQSAHYYQNWYMPALTEAVGLEMEDPDYDPIWMGFQGGPDSLGDYWTNPFHMR